MLFNFQWLWMFSCKFAFYFQKNLNKIKFVLKWNKVHTSLKVLFWKCWFLGWTFFYLNTLSHSGWAFGELILILGWKISLFQEYSEILMQSYYRHKNTHIHKVFPFAQNLLFATPNQKNAYSLADFLRSFSLHSIKLSRTHSCCF